jgi:hypothetical protein
MCFLFSTGYPTRAQGLIGAPIKIKRIQDNWQMPYPYPENCKRLLFSVPKNSDVHGMIDIGYSISADGNMHDLHLNTSSGVDEFDFDCLTALLGSLPYSKSLPVSQTKDIHFGLASGDCGITKNDMLRLKNQKVRQQFRTTNVFDADKFFLLNTIPVDVYFRYPGLLTMDQLINQKNLVAIPKSWFDSRNETTFDEISSNRQFREYFERWSNFFVAHSSTTKEELEEFSKKQVTDYPLMLFSPQPRNFNPRTN